jgi:hypothetical protein
LWFISPGSEIPRYGANHYNDLTQDENHDDHRPSDESVFKHDQHPNDDSGPADFDFHLAGFEVRSGQRRTADYGPCTSDYSGGSGRWPGGWPCDCRR